MKTKKRKPYFNKTQMAKIRELQKKYDVTLNRAAEMYIQSGIELMKPLRDEIAYLERTLVYKDPLSAMILRLHIKELKQQLKEIRR